jgi:hypothetical protein
MAAAEARCGPKQSTNDEGTARDLQIRDEEWAALFSVGWLTRDCGKAH